VSEDEKTKPVTNATNTETSAADKQVEPEEKETEKVDKSTRVPTEVPQVNAAEPKEAESTEKGAEALPIASAEEEYFASFEKDDTLVKKPKTIPIVEEPDVERSVRWGSVFLGKSAMLALRVKGRQEPIHIEISDRYVIGRVHPRSDDRPDLDLNRYGAFFHGVSRKHVAITKDGNLLQIEDLGSTNGTYLNGAKLLPHQPRMLRDGDELCLGHLVMRVHFLNLESDLLH
jgi:hypothetical protein